MDATVLRRLEEASAKREGLRGLTNAIRLVNGFGDEMDGLVLEQHGRHFVAQVFHERWLREKETLVAFVKARGAAYFIVKDRTAGASSDPDAIRFDVWIPGDSATVVEEYGIKFKVDLNDTLNTGLFLDMRSNRHRVAGMSRGRKVLNLFAYTSAFGVHCRMNGAVSAVNVDVSRKVLERSRVNYELNGLVPEKNELIRADAMEYLERAVKKDNRFGMIILDPPSFARYEGRAFSVKKDLPRAVDMAVRVLDPGGVLFVATNYSEMLHSHLQNIVKAAISGTRASSGTRTKLKGNLVHVPAQHVPARMQCLGQDVDFPGTGFMAESCLTAVLAEL